MYECSICTMAAFTRIPKPERYKLEELQYFKCAARYGLSNTHNDNNRPKFRSIRENMDIMRAVKLKFDILQTDYIATLPIFHFSLDSILYKDVCLSHYTFMKRRQWHKQMPIEQIYRNENFHY